MSISVGGLISGMDTENIISQLLEIERKPITNMQQQQADYTVKLNAYGTIESGLKGIRSAARNLDAVSDLTSYAASSGNTDLLTADAMDDAVTGTYSVTVHNLATVHKVKSSAFAPDEVAGAGTIHLKIGDASALDISVDVNDTIANIAEDINNADAGVYATVIYDGTNYYLTLTGQDTGEDNVINLTVTETGTDPADPENQDTTGLSRLVYDRGITENLTQTQNAEDSLISVDGIDNIKRSTNTIDDVISGVTLYLKDEDPLSPLTVSVNRSDTLFTSRVNSFLTAYNGLVDTLKNLQLYVPDTQETGTLFADSTTRRIDQQIQGLIARSVPGAEAGFANLTNLGITTDEDGKLTMDASAFSRKLTEDFDAVADFFTASTSGAEGFAVKFIESIDDILNTDSGTLTVRTDGIQDSIDDMDEQIERLQARLTNTEHRLKAQFVSLEILLGQYKNVSDSLTSQLDALSNLSSYVAKGK